MKEALRRFALSGLETQKQGVAVRFRQAATAARDAGGGHSAGSGGLAQALADRLETAAVAIEGRDVEDWLREALALARRHPAATAAVAAAAAFAVTRLALPASGTPRVAPAREGGWHAG